MNSDKEKIDSLLRRNAAEQIAGVNWDELNEGISSRLDEAQQRKTTAAKFIKVLKTAAIPAAAAAVVFIAVMVGSTGEKGSAKVTFIDPSHRTQVQVDIGGKHAAPATCSVRIIESSTAQKRAGQTRPNWFLISKAESASTINGAGRDVRDIVCLF